jgi:hypothetical protein
MRRAIGRFWLVAACVAFFAAGCIDDHEAEECKYLGTCPPPPDAGPPSCQGTCVPLGYAEWSAPFLVWLGDAPQAPACPSQASRDYYDGVAAPPAPVCDACACEASTGACVQPATVTAHADACPGTGSGTAFASPIALDGTCTMQDAIAGGVESVTVAPLIVNENGCVPSPPVVTQDLPKVPTLAHGCTGVPPDGACQTSGDTCLPTVPSPGSWTYCIMHDGAGDEYTKQCPKGSPYKNLFVFADDFSDSRTCAPCTCGQPEGSACSSLVSFFTDGACSDQVASVTALSSTATCDHIPSTSPLGSTMVSPPTYTPGTCAASGGDVTGQAIPDAPVTLCCLPEQSP